MTRAVIIINQTDENLAAYDPASIAEKIDSYKKECRSTDLLNARYNFIKTVRLTRFVLGGLLKYVPLKHHVSQPYIYKMDNEITFDYHIHTLNAFLSYAYNYTPDGMFGICIFHQALAIVPFLSIAVYLKALDHF